MISKPLIVLAGGFGTRLKSVINATPKALADINGTPFLTYLFSNWIRAGFNNFIFSLHYESEQIIEYLNKNRNTFLENCSIQYVVEPTPMGTGGAISFLLEKLYIEDDFFLTNADTWVEFHLDELDKFPESTIGIINVQDTGRFGKVEIDKDLYVTEFKEKDNNSSKGYINAGIYKLRKALFINTGLFNYSLEKSVFPQLVKENKIKACIIESKFLDIGVPEDYNLFCNWVKEGEISL
jgi:D-glycero-alpha-D-manno-heptose 1-phosphate guanylyltransferase